MVALEEAAAAAADGYPPHAQGQGAGGVAGAHGARQVRAVVADAGCGGCRLHRRSACSAEPLGHEGEPQREAGVSPKCKVEDLILSDRLSYFDDRLH